jgi:hypothetical protein
MDRQNLISTLAGTAPQAYVVCDDQSTNDIIRQILVKHNECISHYDKIFGYFEGGSLYDVCKRLWTFCRKNFNYVVEDEKRQYTSCPLTMLRNGDVDCKNYALFIAGILDAMRRAGEPLTWKFRFASYSIFKPRMGHVFVVVNPGTDDIWIDPVLDAFDDHAFYWYHLDRKPKGANLGAIGRIERIGVPRRPAAIGSAEGDLLNQLLEYQQGLVQAMQLSHQTSTLNSISAGVLMGITTALIPGLTAALQVLKLGQAPLNNAFGVGSVAARVYGDLTSFNVVGLFNDIFNGRTYNTDQYWGAAFYYYFVQGQSVNNQNEVSDQQVLPALKWFIDRLGVFISGREHIMALIQGPDAYLALASVNTDTTTNRAQVQAASQVAQQYFRINGAPSPNYGNFDPTLRGAWKNTVGVFDTGIIQIANQYGVTPETYAAQTGDQYAINETQGLPATAPAGSTASSSGQLIDGIDNMWLYAAAALLTLYGATS